MKFSTLKFGETCARHPAPAPRGLDNAGAFKGPPKPESGVVARNRASGDWAKWDPQPARPATAGPSSPATHQGTTTARPPVSASSAAVNVSTADLLAVPSRAPPRTKPSVEEEKALLRGATTPVYMEEPPSAARPSTAGGLAGRATGGPLPNPNNSENAEATYDAERVIDAFITRVGQRALEKSNFNPSPQVQARALQQELTRFGKGTGITRTTMEQAFTFMATSLRPRALDALWLRINPHSADSVSFQQAAKICVGIDVPPRARPEVRVKLETIRQKLQQRYPPGQGIAALRRGFAIIDKDVQRRECTLLLRDVRVVCWGTAPAHLPRRDGESA